MLPSLLVFVRAASANWSANSAKISKRVSRSWILMAPISALENAARAADQRQQPFGIGVAVAADIEPEPDHGAGVLA